MRGLENRDIGFERNRGRFLGDNFAHEVGIRVTGHARGTGRKAVCGSAHTR